MIRRAFVYIYIFLSAPQPECTRNEECPLTLACINQECKDPCFKHVCGINADCKVKRHRPICFCLPGFVGNPDQICEERKIVIIFMLWQSLHDIYFIAAGCKSDNECPLTQACIQRECQDPCIYERCGTNAQCVVQSHRATCICPPNYRGNPYDSCRRPECVTDPDCPTTLACRNEKCVDPCECARHAYCQARNHRGVCTCEPGYTGDPYGIACTESKFQCWYHSYMQRCFFQSIPLFLVPKIIEPDCRTDSQCDSQLACIDEECVNPCQVIDPCARDADCRVHDTLPLRTMSCICRPGFTGNGHVRCDVIGTFNTIFYQKSILF